MDKRRVPDPGGVDPDPTFKKKPDQYPTVKKKPSPYPTLEKQPDPEPQPWF